MEAAALVNAKTKIFGIFCLVFLALLGWVVCLRLLCIFLLQFVGQETVQAEAEAGPSSSCSSPDEKSYYGDDWSYSLELANEYTFDGERLNQMVPVPVSAALLVMVKT